MSTAFIGIDPGLTGAMGVIDTQHGILIEDIPVLKTSKGKTIYDFYSMYKLLGKYAGWYDNVILSLEQQQAMPQQGVSSTFQTGVGYGAWLALCWAVTPNFEVVSPRKWKKKLGLTNDKEKSRAMAAELYPEMAEFIKRKKDHNRAEALLLAHYTKLERGK